MGVGPWPISYGEILWWTSLTDAPDDVLEFLEFLMSQFSDLDKAFAAIDGPDGNGVVTLMEFEVGAKKLKCPKFQNDRQRIVNVFRYLDPGDQGSVSRTEWGVLKELAKELQMSIQEFLTFLHRMFDGDFLGAAWELLDDDNSGSVSKEEWNDAVQQRLKYFGPCHSIFAYIDKDDEGQISLDEWRNLEDFKSTIQGI